MPLIEVGDCPVHGTVPSNVIAVVGAPQHNTGPTCAMCYVEWVKENVLKLTNVRGMQV
jgi:hypothetical protein